MPNVSREMIPSFLRKKPAIPENFLEICPSISDVQKRLPTVAQLKQLTASVPNVWYRCPNTNKPEVCPENLLKLSAMIGSAAIVGGVAGYYILPAIGFSPIGPDPGSVAAYSQSIYGNVASGSLFSTCQSLAMTSTGAIKVGAVAAGLTFLASMVAQRRLDWCTCQYEEQQMKFLALLPKEGVQDNKC